MRYALLLLLAFVAVWAAPASASASALCMTQPWGTSEAADADCEAAEPNCSLPELTEAERGPPGPRCLQPGAECGPDTRLSASPRTTLAFEWPAPVSLPCRGVGLLPGAEPARVEPQPLERSSPPASPPPRWTAVP